VPRSQQLPSERIAADLRQQIHDGTLKAGEPLPSVTALAERYGCGRATVSRALSALVSEGLVVTRERWGTFVV
jgi:DNA-binding GntR family transcriptional regulator